jgi:hypothetical protein
VCRSRRGIVRFQALISSPPEPKAWQNSFFDTASFIDDAPICGFPAWDVQEANLQRTSSLACSDGQGASTISVEWSGRDLDA